MPDSAMPACVEAGRDVLGAVVAAVTKTIKVAAGVFAPGHLGELTAQVPFELVDAVLAETRATQRRVRALPSRVGVYFVLALGLFPGLGYGKVWGKLVAGLGGLPVPRPSDKALRDLRRRVGMGPIKALFEVLAGPVAAPRTPGVRFGRYRTVAFDDCTSIKVADTGRNRAWLGKLKAALGITGYPALELMTLVETRYRATYRLATTLLDPGRAPANALIALYHERWEHELAYLALRHTLLHGRVLRSADPQGLQQEMWALLTLYQALRRAMVNAIESRPGTDPDRASFTTTLTRAQDLLVTAENIITDRIDLVGDIGNAILADLLPPRRPRTSIRKVKSPLSRYNKKDPYRPERSTPITALDITIQDTTPSRSATHPDQCLTTAPGP